MTTALRALERTKVKPILFSGPMVRALLEGRKTQTRRVIKPQPKLAPHHEPVRPEPRGNRRWVWMVRTDSPSYQFATGDWRSPYTPGDLLWVRETWCRTWDAYDSDDPPRHPTIYRADNHPCEDIKWRPAIHMPRTRSRLTLEVTGVKVERLQEISEEDAIAEGVDVDKSGHFLSPAWRNYAYGNYPFKTAVASFRSLWNSLNAKRGYGWEANPWICAVSFRVHQMNIDAFLAQREAA